MTPAEQVFDLPGARVSYLGQGRLAVYEPGSNINGVVLALHGSGRGIADYTEVPFYKRQLEISFSYGFAFAVLENGPDTYGTDDGVFNTCLAADALMKMYGADRIALWATSAGGRKRGRLYGMSRL